MISNKVKIFISSLTFLVLIGVNVGHILNCANETNAANLQTISDKIQQAKRFASENKKTLLFLAALWIGLGIGQYHINKKEKEIKRKESENKAVDNIIKYNAKRYLDYSKKGNDLLKDSIIINAFKHYDDLIYEKKYDEAKIYANKMNTALGSGTDFRDLYFQLPKKRNNLLDINAYTNGARIK